MFRAWRPRGIPSGLPAKSILTVILFVIHLLPIWIFRYFPSQDGPSHLYNAYLLKEYHNPENSKIREIFKINLTLFPNWSSHALMALLMHVFPPRVTEKLLVSLCVALLPVSLYCFLRSVDPKKTPFSLLGFLYAYNYMLHMGFYNFALSMSLFFFTMGYWWKHKDAMNPSRIGILYGLLLGTYLTHYVSYVLLVISLSSLTVLRIPYALYEQVQQGAGRNARTAVRLSPLKALFSFVGYMSPAYFIMLSYYLSSTYGHRPEYWDAGRLMAYFWDHKSLVYFRDDYVRIMHWLLGFYAVAASWTIAGWIRDAFKHEHTGPPGDPAASSFRPGLRILGCEAPFFLLAGGLTILFFVSPWEFHSGGAWINDRIHLYIFLVLLPFFKVPSRRFLRYLVMGFLAALSLWHLGYSVRDYRLLNKEIADLTSGAELLEKNTTLTARSSDWMASEYLGRVKYVSPFLHAPAYYALGNGVAYLPNYEAGLDYFPIDFKKRYTRPADYVLLWRMDDPREHEALEKDYVLIHSGKHVRLYRLRKTSG